MNVLITNTVPLNTGDAAILEAEILLLRKMFGADVCIQIHGAQWEIARRYYPEWPVRPELSSRLFTKSTSSFWESVWSRLERTHERPDVYRFYAGAWLHGRGYALLSSFLLTQQELDALKEYASADLIISTGGTYLVEHYSLDGRIINLRTSLLLGKPLVLYTQSMGPFFNPKYRRRLRAIFREASAILLRDEMSEQHVRELVPRSSNRHVTSDVVFALADPEKWRPAPSAIMKLKVAVSVREWSHFKRVRAAEGRLQYLSSMRELIEHLVRVHAASVVLVSTCQGIPEYWTDDSQLARGLLAELPQDVSNYVGVDSDFHSPAELIELLRGFDLVISTRMHMAILALDAGTPVIAVAYEFKTLELFRELGHPQLAHDIEDITPRSLIDSADDVLADLPNFRDSLRRETLRQRERVFDSATKVQRSLCPNP